MVKCKMVKCVMRGNVRIAILIAEIIHSSALFALAALTTTAVAHADDGGKPAQTVTPQAAEFFEKKVRPLLFDKCFSCHGDKSANGGLRLDSLEAIMKGGASGPVLTPGNPAKSRIIDAVQYSGSIKMPPDGRLSADSITILTQWVKMGAPWPAAKPTAPSTGEFVITPEQAAFWSFKPVSMPAVPKVKGTWWVKSPIDAFIMQRLEAKGLKPSPVADRRTLIRRATYDLTGLPPTASEVDAFLADKAAGAFSRVVDRLLASPRYGERWGRHWLDVARYADTKGYAFTEDAVYHNAYTYRDYVIRSFNEDLPYDQFIIEQIAADRLPQGDDKRKLAALGFLNVGRRFLNDPVLINDDRIDSTCRGFMALTVGCARCHNHKFDPISAKDYYSLYGVFASASEQNPPPAISPRSISEPYEAQNAKISAVDTQIDSLVRGRVTALRDRAAKSPGDFSKELKETLQSIRLEALPDARQLKILSPSFDADGQATLKKLQDSANDLRAHMPAKPEFAMASVDNAHPFDPYVFIRGNAGNRGPNVPREFIQLLSGPDRKPYTDGGRLQLAQDIASTKNPLTARVLVNRVWMYHFGAAIVRTPSDFGTRGEPPTNQELLDWLAATFMDDGWSIKKLHRRIMLSSAYQQSSDISSRPFLIDPENRLIWKQNRQRLDFEALRDSLLSVSGKLDTTLGGPAVEITTAPYSARRTVYGFIDRQNLQGLFRAFDFASPDTSSAQRYNTTVPQQSLFMMNSPFVVEQAKATAQRQEVTTAANDIARIRAVYRIIFEREPASEEIGFARKFLQGVGQFRSAADPNQAPSAVHTASITTAAQQHSQPLSPWEEYVQTLLLTNEFLFVD